MLHFAPQMIPGKWEIFPAAASGFPLNFRGGSRTVHLFECAFDALSYAALMKMGGKKWKEFHLPSLGGVYAPKSYSWKGEQALCILDKIIKTFKEVRMDIGEWIQ